MGDNNNNDNNKYNKEGSSENIVNILSHTWVTITITIIRKEHLIVTSFYVVKIPSHTWVTIY